MEKLLNLSQNLIELSQCRKVLLAQQKLENQLKVCIGDSADMNFIGNSRELIISNLFDVLTKEEEDIKKQIYDIMYPTVSKSQKN